jgi:hypothetical protein
MKRLKFLLLRAEGKNGDGVDLLLFLGREKRGCPFYIYI